MQPIYDWFRAFYERTGVNLTFIYDDFDRARMIKNDLFERCITDATRKLFA